MFRAVTTVAAIAALAVTAAPASAGQPKAKDPRPVAGFAIDIGTSERLKPAPSRIEDGTSNTLTLSVLDAHMEI